MSSSDLVAPFQGERYAAVDQLSRLIAPPYDVIDAAERAHLAALDEHNIVHVMLPEAPDGRPPDTRYAMAAELREHVVVERDPGVDGCVAAAVDLQGDLDRRLLGLTLPRCETGHERTS